MCQGLRALWAVDGCLLRLLVLLLAERFEVPGMGFEAVMAGFVGRFVGPGGVCLVFMAGQQWQQWVVLGGFVFRLFMKVLTIRIFESGEVLRGNRSVHFGQQARPKSNVHSASHCSG